MCLALAILCEVPSHRFSRSAPRDRKRKRSPLSFDQPIAGAVIDGALAPSPSPCPSPIEGEGTRPPPLRRIETRRRENLRSTSTSAPLSEKGPKKSPRSMRKGIARSRGQSGVRLPLPWRERAGVRGEIGGDFARSKAHGTPALNRKGSTGVGIDGQRRLPYEIRTTKYAIDLSSPARPPRSTAGSGRSARPRAGCGPAASARRECPARR